MLIVENRVKTFFRLLWNKIKFICCCIGMIVFVLGSSMVLIDFDNTPSKNKDTIERIETRIEVLEKIHNIDLKDKND